MEGEVKKILMCRVKTMNNRDNYLEVNNYKFWVGFHIGTFNNQSSYHAGKNTESGLMDEVELCEEWQIIWYTFLTLKSSPNKIYIIIRMRIANGTLPSCYSIKNIFKLLINYNA